jgi:hypothetical protein
MSTVIFIVKGDPIHKEMLYITQVSSETYLISEASKGGPSDWPARLKYIDDDKNSGEFHEGDILSPDRAGVVLSPDQVGGVDDFPESVETLGT